MKIAFIGLPDSGKTTVFNALTRQNIPLEEYASIDKPKAHLGAVHVPDARIDELASVFKPNKTTYAELTFVDIAHPPIQKEGSARKDFEPSPVREADAFVHVVRAFENSNVPHPKGEVNPVRDIALVESDLIVLDLEVAQHRIKKIELEFQKGKRDEEKEYNVLKRLVKELESEIPLRETAISEEEGKLIRAYQFLSQKPTAVVLNISEDEIGKPLSDKLKALSQSMGIIPFCGKLEMEILELDESERAEYLKGIGLNELSHDVVLDEIYMRLNLISFFTVVGGEVKAWSIRKGTKAIEAAGKVHSDMERGFIKAEIIGFDDFKRCNFSFPDAKAKGLLRLEAKDYIIRDGDVINFKFSV
ncbi:MAG: redox-regulated ATPase YchF [Candidatus Omnitrophota bacterium]